MASLSMAGLTADTAQVYLAAVRNAHLRLGLDTTIFRNPRLTAIVQGLRRSQLRGTAARLPMTLSQLHLCQRRLLTAKDRAFQDRQMVWTAIATAYFGLLRVGEYTSPTPTGFNTGRTFLRSDVRRDGQTFTLCLRMSKTYQLRVGTDVVIGSTGNHLCPVSALVAYMRNTSNLARDAPFFQFASRRFLTPRDVNRELARIAGPSIRSHSLRSGGATRLAEIGAPTWQLQEAGRWCSYAFRRYIRPRNSVRAGLPTRMAHKGREEHGKRR